MLLQASSFIKAMILLSYLTGVCKFHSKIKNNPLLLIIFSRKYESQSLPLRLACVKNLEFSLAQDIDILYINS